MPGTAGRRAQERTTLRNPDRSQEPRVLPEEAPIKRAAGTVGRNAGQIRLHAEVPTREGWCGSGRFIKKGAGHASDGSRRQARRKVLTAITANEGQYLKDQPP